MIRFTGTTPPLAGRCQEIFFDPANSYITDTGIVESSVGDRTTKDTTNKVYNGRSVTTTGLPQMSGFVVGSGRSNGVPNQFGADCSPLFANAHTAYSDMCLSFSIMLRDSTVNTTSFSFGALTDAPYYTLRIIKGTTPAATRIEIITTDNYVDSNSVRTTVTTPTLFYPLVSPIYNASLNVNTLFNKWLNITVLVTRTPNNVAAPTTYTLNYNVRLFINGIEHQPYTSIAFNTTTTNTFTKSIGFPWTNSTNSGIFFKLLSTVTSYGKINFRNNFVEAGGTGDVSLHDFRVYENTSSFFPTYNPSSKSSYVTGLMNPILSPDSTRNLVLRYMLETGPQNIPNASITGVINTTKNVGLVGILPVFIKGSNNIYNYGLYPGPPISFYSGYSNKPLIKSITSFGTQLSTAIHDGATSSNIRLVTSEKTITSASTGNDLILFSIQLDDGLDTQDYLVKDLLVVPTEESQLDLFLGRYPRVELWGMRDGDANFVRLLIYNQGDGGTYPNNPPTSCSVYTNYAGTPGIKRAASSTGVKEGLTFSILNAPSGVTYDTNSPISPANLANYISSRNYFKKYEFRIVKGSSSNLSTCTVSNGTATSSVTGSITIDRINSNYYIEHIFCNVIKQNIPVVNNYSVGFRGSFDTGQFRNTFNFREKFNVYTTKYFDLQAHTPFSLVNNVGHDTVSPGDNFYVPSYQKYTFDIPFGVIETTTATINPTGTPTFGTTGYQPAIATQRLPTGETLTTSTAGSRELTNGQTSAIVLPFLNQNWKGQPSSINSIANTNNTITLRKRGKIRATASMVQSNCFKTSTGGNEFKKIGIIDWNNGSPIDLNLTGAIITNGSGDFFSLTPGNSTSFNVPANKELYNITINLSGTIYHFPVAEGRGTFFYCSNNFSLYAQIDDTVQWVTQDVYHYNFHQGFSFYTNASSNTIRVPIGTVADILNSTQTPNGGYSLTYTNLGANKTKSWNNCESKIKFTSPEVLNAISLTTASGGTPITNNISNSSPDSIVLTKAQVVSLCNTTTSGFKRMIFCMERGDYLSHLTFYRTDIVEEGSAVVQQLDNYFK